ncbi:MAG: hypothetical protein P4L41_01870 [Flavipsychrobacter sp.]|nr:hypothetical protein [Flavipsychrobacter sp.]
MEFADFENHILNLVGKDHFGMYCYLLPSIKVVFRVRFIHILHSGFNIPTAYDQLNIAAKLPDKNFQRYLNFISAKTAGQKLVQL